LFGELRALKAKQADDRQFQQTLVKEMSTVIKKEAGMNLMALNMTFVKE